MYRFRGRRARMGGKPNPGSPGTPGQSPLPIYPQIFFQKNPPISQKHVQYLHLLDLYIDAPYLRSNFSCFLARRTKLAEGKEKLIVESQAFSDIFGHAAPNCPLPPLPVIRQKLGARSFTALAAKTIALPRIPHGARPRTLTTPDPYTMYYILWNPRLSS